MSYRAVGHSCYRKVIIEADGGSRGNPGPAAFGALVRDADTGQVLAEAAESIGIATNNVAEYRGLIAGLELVRQIAPEAEVEARMDSKLVVEQMAGRWKIKHPDMKPLATQANRLASEVTTWTWVPREQNSAADALLNKVLDGGPPIWRIVKDPNAAEQSVGNSGSTGDPGSAASLFDVDPGTPGSVTTSGISLSDPDQPPTVLVMHAGAGPSGAVEVAPVASLQGARGSRDRLLRTHAGTTVHLVADLTTIGWFVVQALGGKQEMADRLEVAPGSVTEIAWRPDGHGVLRRFSAQT